MYRQRRTAPGTSHCRPRPIPHFVQPRPGRRSPSSGRRFRCACILSGQRTLASLRLRQEPGGRTDEQFMTSFRSGVSCCAQVFRAACLWCSGPPRAYGNEDGPDNENNRSGSCPGRGWADDLLAVCDAEDRTDPEDSCALQEPQQAEKNHKCADNSPCNLSCTHARSSAVHRYSIKYLLPCRVVIQPDAHSGLWVR